MDREELYDVIAQRKTKPKDYEPYAGDNGRVNKCVNLMRQGKLRTGGRLVDIGGGIGDLGYAVKDLFDECIVVDICDKSNEAARAKGNITLTLDIDKHGLEPLGNSSVDVITALDFIEHIVDPENFARECFRVLKPSGEVFINTPNIRFWKHIDALWKHGRFPHTSGDREVFHGGHLAFFTALDLCDIFEPAGFTRCGTFKDEECYEQPPQSFVDPLLSRITAISTSEQLKTTQQQYVEACLELGCPNLLKKFVVKK